ncbi:unnamed protein product, partial [Rotaria sp. Silwood2]
MSSITIAPKLTLSYATTAANNLPNINLPPMRPLYLQPYAPQQQQPPTYHHIKQQIQRTTTTFNGYTNFSGTRTTNLPPRRNLPPPPLPRTIYYHNPYHNNYNNPYYHHRRHYNNFNYTNAQDLPSLLDLIPFHLPPTQHTRSFNNAQQYHPNNQHQHFPRSLSRVRFHVLSQLPSKSRSRSRSYQRPLPPPIKSRRMHHHQQQQQFNRPRYHHQQQHTTTNNNNNINNNTNNFNEIKRTLQGIILSDSMCSRIRTYAVRKLPSYNVELSYESGCDIYKMIEWLSTPEGRALSPRWKPTRFVSAANIGQMHNQFNERLRILSKQLDFDIVDARLGLADMRVEDGLHPSNTTGKWKYEGAIREWFSSRTAAHFSNFFQRRRFPPRTTAPTTPTTTTTLQYYNNMNNYNVDNQRQYQPRRNNNNYNQNRITYVTTSLSNINSTQLLTVTPVRTKKKTPIEKDPRAPEGSPVLLASENSNKEQTVRVVQKNSRPDTPLDPEAKRPRLFSHAFKPPRTAPRSQRQQPQEIVIQQEEEVSDDLPTTPPGLPAPPVLSPRQSTPRTPIAPPRPLETSPQIDPSYQVENRNEPQVVERITVVEKVTPMEQEIIRNSPSVIPKDMEDFKMELFDFPFIPIECKFHFKIFHMTANVDSITAHKEFLEKKAKQQENKLEHLMKEVNEDFHKIV